MNAIFVILLCQKQKKAEKMTTNVNEINPAVQGVEKAQRITPTSIGAACF